MTPDIRTLIDRHHVSYDVSPYYVVNEVHRNGAPVVRQTIQAGFDVYLYGTGVGADLKLSPDSEQARVTLNDLEKIAHAVQSKLLDSQAVEILPVSGTLDVFPSHRFAAEAMLLIRITHSRGIDKPAGSLETQTLRRVREQLNALGVRSGLGQWTQ